MGFLSLVELGGRHAAAVPMRWVNNAVWRDRIDHGYLPKALSLKMTSRPAASVIASRLVERG